MPALTLPYWAASLFFALAVLHTFLVSRFHHLGNLFPEGSTGENFFHLLGEVEVSFGLWASAFIAALFAYDGGEAAISYLNSRNFTEPAFVFVIMAACSTRPVLDFARLFIGTIARILPFSRPVAAYASAMIVGPLLGSLITEPAAMTITSLILIDQVVKRPISTRFRYLTLALLFVNVSIGGTLTPYAAPPVLMVAKAWGWDLTHMLLHFGWKAFLSTVLGTSAVTYAFRDELKKHTTEKQPTRAASPLWVIIIHLALIALMVVNHHHMVIFVGIFLFFLGLMKVTKEYHDQIRLREGLLVAFFLAGIVVLGEPQRWWLEPLLSSLSSSALYLGAIGLTSITDNAALTFLAAQIPSLPEAARYTVTAGAVIGGGLTVIANAPNPVGYSLLGPFFGADGISPLKLFLAALPFTLLAALIFWVF